MSTIDGITYTDLYVHGDGAYFSATGVLVAKRKVVNGHDNTGYTERIRLFSDINMGDDLPATYPDFDTLYNPITAPVGSTGPTGLGWPYDIAKKLADRPIDVFGPSGVTAVAGVTYIYEPYDLSPYFASGVTGPSEWVPPVKWAQEKVEVYIDGVLE